jgi:hypothetical protein
MSRTAWVTSMVWPLGEPQVASRIEIVRGTSGRPPTQSMRTLRPVATTSDSTKRCGWQVQMTANRLSKSSLVWP